ncbi:MAG: ferritin [Bacteroidales bacterium]|nr:ferritin [Bacteroidales bacterium]
MNSKVVKALNDQIQAELYSSYLYLSMAAYFADANLNGFSHWMKIQAQEEYGHAMRIFDYLNERNQRVELLSIQQPPKDWSSPKQAFEDAYKHECYISDRINKILELAIEEKDYATQNFLQWFIAEQVEEEASVNEILQHLNMIEGNTGLLMLDKELKKRS